MGIGTYGSLTFVALTLMAVSGPVQTGPAQTGPMQTGPMQTGLGQVGPERVVSLDYCADATLLALADEGVELYLSPDAAQSFAWGAGGARYHKRHGGSTEEILSLNPDLVIHSGLGHLKAVAMLDRFGVEIVDIGYSESLNHARQAVLTVGEALDRVDAAEHLLETLDHRLEKVARTVAVLDRAGPRPQALYITPSSNTTGAGTYLDEVMTLAGIDNSLAVRGVVGWASFDLEDMAENAPDMVISSFFESLSGWQSAWLFSRHPVTRQVMDQAMLVEVPARQWSCGGYFIVSAVETLVEARVRWQNIRMSGLDPAHRRAGVVE